MCQFQEIQEPCQPVHSNYTRTQVRKHIQKGIPTTRYNINNLWQEGDLYLHY